MKRLLIFTLYLLSIASYAQVVVSPIQFKLNGITVTGKFLRDLSKYPYVTGFSAAKTAAETTRPFNITLTSGSRNGKVLAALTTPSTTPPAGNTTTSGGTSPAGSTFAYNVPATGSAPAWTGYNGTGVSSHGAIAPKEIAVQDNSELRLEVRNGFGGSIQIFDKVTNQNLINFFDQGRETGMSSYSYPISFSDDAPVWKGIGYNPLQAGDAGDHPAILIRSGTVDGYIYTKYQCLSWAHVDARALLFYYEQWVKLDGNKVRVKVRLTHNRADKTFYEARQQEWPMMMINGARNLHFYNGPVPYTNAGTTVTNSLEAGGTVPDGLKTPFMLTENWMGTEIGPNAGANTRMIGLTGSEFYRASYNVAVPQAGDNYEGGNTMTYWQHAPMAHLDSDGIWYREYDYVVGTEAQIRAYAYSLPRKATPDYSFTKSNGRAGWIIWDGGYDQKEPFAVDNWNVTFTGKPGSTNVREAHLQGPIGSWKASDFNTVYIRYRYTGTESQLFLQYIKQGQAADGIPGGIPIAAGLRFPNGAYTFWTQTKGFPVIGDGQYHTVAVNLTGDEWNGIIQQFKIRHHYDGPAIAPGEQLGVSYIGTTNPGN